MCLMDNIFGNLWDENANQSLVAMEMHRTESQKIILWWTLGKSLTTLSLLKLVVMLMLFTFWFFQSRVIKNSSAIPNGTESHG